MIRVGFIRHGILSIRNEGPRGAPWALAAVLLPTLIKFGLDAVIAGSPPFLTYFPALTLAAVFLGPSWGMAVAVTSAALANYLFMERRFDWAASPDDLVVIGMYLVGAVMIIATASGLKRAVHEVAEARERERALNIELRHRVKNNLAVVQALASQTARSIQDPAEFYGAFQGRLMALSEAHDVLSQGHWGACHVPGLVEGALRPFRVAGAITALGPPCHLPPNSCVPLVLALHELATNATKYGALSVPSGRVRITWAIEGSRFRLRWQEELGPRVHEPRRRGLGVRLLTRQRGLDDVLLEFRPDGVRCELVVDGAELVSEPEEWDDPTAVAAMSHVPAAR